MSSKIILTTICIVSRFVSMGEGSKICFVKSATQTLCYNNIIDNVIITTGKTIMNLLLISMQYCAADFTPLPTLNSAVI